MRMNNTCCRHRVPKGRLWCFACVVAHQGRTVMWKASSVYVQVRTRRDTKCRVVISEDLHMYGRVPDSLIGLNQVGLDTSFRQTRHPCGCPTRRWGRRVNNVGASLWPIMCFRPKGVSLFGQKFRRQVGVSEKNFSGSTVGLVLGLGVRGSNS